MGVLIVYTCNWAAFSQPKWTLSSLLTECNYMHIRLGWGHLSATLRVTWNVIWSKKKKKKKLPESPFLPADPPQIITIFNLNRLHTHASAQNTSFPVAIIPSDPCGHVVHYLWRHFHVAGYLCASTKLVNPIIWVDLRMQGETARSYAHW